MSEEITCRKNNLMRLLRIQKLQKNDDNAREEKRIKKDIKCRFENTGKCKTKNCTFVHPIKTCKQHSVIGSCSMESSCDRRHPYGVCYEWEARGSCHQNDNCRHRHPFELEARKHSKPVQTRMNTHGWSHPANQWQPRTLRFMDVRGIGRY